MVTFTVEGRPFGKQRPHWNTKVGGSRPYTPQKTVDYEELIRMAYRKQCKDGKFSEKTPLSISIIAVFEPPKSNSKKKRQAKLDGKIKPTVKPDWDNIAKIVCDALNGLAWEDDSQIISGFVVKTYGEKASVRIMIDEVKENSI